MRWGWLVRFGQAHVWVETLAVAKEQCPAFIFLASVGGPMLPGGALSSYCALWLYQGLVPQSSSSPLQL